MQLLQFFFCLNWIRTIRSSYFVERIRVFCVIKELVYLVHIYYIRNEI